MNDIGERVINETEWDLLEALWERERGTAREIADAVSDSRGMCIEVAPPGSRGGYASTSYQNASNEPALLYWASGFRGETVQRNRLTAIRL